MCEENQMFFFVVVVSACDATSLYATKHGASQHDHFFFAPPPRGGVMGRPDSEPPYGNFAFFSAGLRIWKEHISVSSTLIMAPALSNSPQ